MSNDTKQFVWTDDNVRHFAEWYRRTQGNPNADIWGKDLLEVYKQSKLQFQDKQVGWEIIEFSFKHKNGEILSIGSEPATEYYYEVLKEYPDVKIRSVKRLSDGETFSIGDNIQHDIFPSKVPYKIDGFKVSDIGSDKGTLYFCGEYPVTFKFPSTWPIKKVAQPFSTEDKGKDREEIKLPLSQIKHLYDLWGSLKTGKPFMEFVYSRVIF
jgi:predicted SnoaL-like aldol condensation-catalyzing enzyme